MKSDRETEETKEKEEQKTENADEAEKEGGIRSYHFFPVLSLSLISAIEILILQQSVSGAVRNFIVVAVIAFAAMLSCGRWVTSRITFYITVLGFAASLQAFIPDFIIPVAAFAVLIAVVASSPYLGISCLMLFSCLPFLVTDRSYEYFLFYTVTGLIGIALIYGSFPT